MAEILSYEQVDICYNGVPAVKDVSFALQKSEILVIAGESGSGKSTLIRAAMGLLGKQGQVTRGDIWYQGRNLPDLSRRELRRICGAKIGMIFQNAGASFCPNRTVGKQLYESLKAHEPITKEAFYRKAEVQMKKLGFSDAKGILDSYPFELSGGMQQRVGIAAAMLPEPEILLADEPTSALDVYIQKQVVEELLMIRREYGTSMILVTHNLAVARRIADRMLIMKDGQIVEQGSVAQIFAQPACAYTRQLLAAVPELRR